MPVQHVKRRSRSIFRRLRFGQAYWLSTNVATAPVIKYNRTTTLSGINADGSPILTTVSPTNVAVVKVPPRMARDANWHG